MQQGLLDSFLLGLLVKMDRKSLKGTKYFEGILQLRNPTKEVIQFVKNDVAKQPEERGIFINKEEKIDTGLDLYITSKNYIRSIGKKLQSRFGGQLIESAKLFTKDRQTSKNVYRVNVLFRLPKFKKEDIIKYKGMDLKIKAIGKKVFCTDIKTGRKYTIKFKELI